MFYRAKYFLLVCLCAAASVVLAGANPDAKVSERDSYLSGVIVDAIKKQSAMPVLSVSFGEIKNVEKAYQLQKMVVETLLDKQPPAGFKAGLTSVATQKRFSVNEPVAGVLLPDINIADSKKTMISSASYRHGVIELEIGYRLKYSVVNPINDIAQLKALIAEVVAVVEFPETGFAAKPRLGDIVATNVGARRYLIAGSKNNFPLEKVNAIEVRLQRGDKLLMQGRADNALGDQLKALQFLINRSLANGWTVEPQQLLITGVLGEVVPMQSGNYRAAWTGLAELNFVIE
jgi:2-keto-4-pentenoate hydratase